MITALTIENFKGIRERVRIPIRPITLLFGPNSGGKSTILQAIHYAREILERRNLDCAESTSGGRFVDLGGFRNFVHGRDPRRQITLGFESLTEPDIFPRYDVLKPHDLARTPHNWLAGYRPMFGLDWPIRAHVELCIASTDDGKPYVSASSVHLNGARFATMSISAADSLHGYCPLELNFEHPFFQAIGHVLWKLDAELENEGEKNLLAKVRSGEKSLMLPSWHGHAIPDPKDRRGDSFELLYNGGHGDCFQIGYLFLDHLLATLVAGPCVVLADQLRDLRYLGPLRDLPTSEYLPPRLPDNFRWVAGLGAWDQLHYGSPEFVAQVSDWLSNPKRLDTGYRLRARRLKELDPESDLWTELRQGRAAKDPDLREKQLLDLPTRTSVWLVKEPGEGQVRAQDVGVGISQVLPLVVACCDPQPPLTMIEQPELHLHPRVQCELGDLLLYGALGHTQDIEVERDNLDEDGNEDGSTVPTRLPRTILVETHSEYLILRILRRIRETTLGKPHDGIPVTPDDLSVCYVSQESGQSVPRTMHVDDQGEFIEPWPDLFFEQDFYERFAPPERP